MTLNRMLDEAPPLQMYEAIEQAMASQKPFGDASYILDQMQRCLGQRLERVALDLPTAGELLDAASDRGRKNLHRLFGEPTLRSAIVHAHEQLVSGDSFGMPLSDCAEIFAVAAQYLREGGADTPLQDGTLVSLQQKDAPGWIWSGEHSNDSFGRAFRELLMARYKALPITLSDDNVELLRTGARLLVELVPSLAPSALAHVRVIGCTPSEGSFTDVASSSQFHLGGAIFLRQSLGTPWWIAEHLLHESLHQKLYDFRHGHSLMRLDHALDDERPVLTPWNPSKLAGANLWNAWRTMAAFHVYVHLSLLALVAERRAPELEGAYGQFAGMLESRWALARARYLGGQLHDVCWDKIGPAGRVFVDWLHSLLAMLDVTPPPAGAATHLYLDLYRREGNRLEKSLSESPDRRAAEQPQLGSLAQKDISIVETVLRDLDADAELQRLHAASGHLTVSELGDNYPRIRACIEACLLQASVDGWRMSESGHHDALVKDMVGGASDSLFALSSHIPAEVAAAKRRAVAMNFSMSCEDGVGRFLAMIANHLPADAKVLELGTGVGVGTAWIVSGIGARNDIEVVSVELDDRLGASTAAYAWPPYVQLEIADARTLVDNPEAFDLIFADATPFKYEHIDAILNSLRPKGMIIVDDVDVSAAGNNEAATPRVAALRSVLLNHSQLLTVDLQNLASGVIVATKRP